MDPLRVHRLQTIDLGLRLGHRRADLSRGSSLGLACLLGLRQLQGLLRLIHENAYGGAARFVDDGAGLQVGERAGTLALVLNISVGQPWP